MALNLKLRLAGVLAGAIVLATSVAAQATTYTIDATEQGYMNPTQTDSTNNYLVGNVTNLGEYRDWFDFSIPTLDGSIKSASLVLYTGTINLFQFSPLTYTVTSTPTFAFAGLGTGAVYGSESFTSSDAGTTISIGLNSSALDDITADIGSSFLISGRDSDPNTSYFKCSSFPFCNPPSASNQFVFGSTQNHVAELVLTTTPLPAALPLFATALGGLGLFGWLRRQKAQAVAT